MKLTSNGTRTSPVVRGVWILENILGDPPSPPPANVEPIEPDVRGSKTIYEMLSKHREIETGAYRKNYRNKKPVYAKGSVPGGSFDGAEDMKQVLLDRSDQFTRTLTEKLFTYALGHPLTFSERIVADDIAAENLAQKDGLKDLLVAICASPLFRGEMYHTEVALLIFTSLYPRLLSGSFKIVFASPGSNEVVVNE